MIQLFKKFPIINKIEKQPLMKPLPHSLLLMLLILCAVSKLPAQTPNKKVTSYVNPFIGTAAVDKKSLTGCTFPGATMPFGFVQLSPDTKHEVNRPCSGYDYKDNTIVGFSHTHLSGTGIADLLDVLIMPITGEAKRATDYKDSASRDFRSAFSHSQEVARPGYYQVKLLDYNVNAELTATQHAGFHRYTFPQSSGAGFVIDMDHSRLKGTGNRSAKILSAQIKIVDNKTIEGYRVITGWAKMRRVYFRAEFSQPFTSNVLFDGNRLYENNSVVMGAAGIKAVVHFASKANEQVLVKVGISATSISNARENLGTEIPAWNFDKVVSDAENAWEKELKQIEIEGTDKQQRIFYTGLYHAFIQPNNTADINGDYPAADYTTGNAADKTHYSTFSLWDTYRATHPLYTIVQQERTAGFINSMIRHYDSYGILPIWQLWGVETYCMIGNHAIPVIVDAALKGIKGFDLNKAYEAIKGSSTRDHVESPFGIYDQYGYMPEDLQSQSVSITLETAYNDWCVAQLAKQLGKTADYDFFIKRSGNYRNLFDNSTGFFRAKDKTGKWIAPFNPLQYGGNGGQPYTEGNAWQYLWYVPHNVPDFISLLGGKKAFVNKLDEFFALVDTVKKNGNASGFIGQYAHGNEPSHHVAYLYNYAGEPWKTQFYVNKVLNEQYDDQPAGYTGNEDCGQMSSWYIFSALGFYPVNPANGIYAIGSPLLSKATIQLPGGKQFTVQVKNAGKGNAYIQSMKMNGKKYSKTYITHQDILNGAAVEFTMGAKPNKQWGMEAPPLQ
jgi:predicted alpha-1,2-mannosidase